MRLFMIKYAANGRANAAISKAAVGEKAFDSLSSGEVRSLL